MSWRDAAKQGTLNLAGRIQERAAGIREGAAGIYQNREEYLKMAHEKAQQAGVGASEYAQWAKAASLEVGSKYQQAAMVVLRQTIQDTYGEEVFGMMEALSNCTQQLKKELGLADAKFGLMLALPLVQIQHSTLPGPKTQKQVKDLAFISELHYYLDYAAGAYGAGIPGGDQANVQKAVGSKGEVMMANLPVSGVQMPGHFVAIDKAKQQVVLGVRGTTTSSDAITDAVGAATPFPGLSGVEAHQAMLAAAQQVLQKTRSTVEMALAANKGFGLLVTGHSLGAGTAILCALLLATTPPPSKPKLRCFAYAPPPVLSTRSLSNSTVKALDVIAIANRNDVVPRASLGNIFHLGQECMAVDKLDMPLMDRINIMRRAAPDGQDKSQRDMITSACADQQTKSKKEPHPELAPLIIPGKFHWIEWPHPPSGDYEAEAKGIEGFMPDQPPPKIWQLDAAEFQVLHLKGGKGALLDHLCSSYDAGIDGAKSDLAGDAAGWVARQRAAAGDATSGAPPAPPVPPGPSIESKSAPEGLCSVCGGGACSIL
eukprot:gnl/TRDRNA2_/TRDRNA2_134712_c0_seq2.p1 gnl/TRDRNA2_/TRDRNA2_134712_c0~~gnl/TRDRNA2_/TRDRNA2_134712_c0_seq2.p1  ORF type:complete len:542 (+),score=104.87 gnl/TRDRNA2_/TRDRNA2_134712_c0_seq2:95-1720(+)